MTFNVADYSRQLMNDFLIAGGKQVTLTELPPGYTDGATANVAGIPVFVIVMVVIVGIFAVLLHATRFGRSVYAVGSNPEAATILGISRALAYQLVRGGELPSIKLGRRVVVPRAALLQLVSGGPGDGAGTPDRCA